MTALARRVRDFRYYQGWGPDELARRSEISRTALYQIESGKTDLPRASTLRRIAKALGVSTSELLGLEPPPASPARPSRAAPVASTSAAGPAHFAAVSNGSRPKTAVPAPFLDREPELISKLRDLLGSPMAQCAAGMIDELHGLLERDGHARAD